MSRHILTPKNEDHEVVVGWDPPLNTFFVHIIDTSKDEEDESYDVLWVGCRFNEILDIQAIMAMVEPHIIIIDQERQTLIKELLNDSKLGWRNPPI